MSETERFSINGKEFSDALGIIRKGLIYQPDGIPEGRPGALGTDLVYLNITPVRDEIDNREFELNIVADIQGTFTGVRFDQQAVYDPTYKVWYRPGRIYTCEGEEKNLVDITLSFTNQPPNNIVYFDILVGDPGQDTWLDNAKTIRESAIDKYYLDIKGKGGTGGSVRP